MNITLTDIELLAPNAAALKNGKDLVAKKKFVKLYKSEDDTLIWGECAGSGANPYICSADYLEPSAPVFRCTCPSRQFPCKHAIGLLHAFATGSNFVQADIPQDILDKRAKIEKKQEHKDQQQKEQVDKPKKVNSKALEKKAGTQLEGIAHAEKMLQSIVQLGLSVIDARTKRDYQEQVKQLGNYSISGIQTAFSDLFLQLEGIENGQYTKVIDQINYLYALLKKSKEHLTAKKENPEAPMELCTAIEEQIGYVWKLDELKEAGLYEKDVEMLQLSFFSYDDQARREFVDEGYWMDLQTGKIYRAVNYRPYKALKYIKEANSSVDILQLKELFIYPGDVNPRARWDEFTTRAISPSDLQKASQYALADYAELVKTAKNILKNPLMDKNPVFLIALHNVVKCGEQLVLEDAAGHALTLQDMPRFDGKTVHTLTTILPSDVRGLYMTVMIHNDVETGCFTVQGLSVLTPRKMIKLLF